MILYSQIESYIISLPDAIAEDYEIHHRREMFRERMAQSPVGSAYSVIQRTREPGLRSLCPLKYTELFAAQSDGESRCRRVYTEFRIFITILERKTKTQLLYNSY
jgi:hypothetical protein